MARSILQLDAARPGTRVIHIDMDPEEIGRNFLTRCRLGDARETLGSPPVSGRAPSSQDHRLLDALRAEGSEVSEVFASQQTPIRPSGCFAISDRVRGTP